MPEKNQSTKNVYFFGAGSAEGKAEMKELLGGKGANLAEMTNLGIPVPPGFTISTEVCAAFYDNDRTYPAGLREEVAEHLERLETMMGKKLGDAGDPLLVSVRSGAAQSMPGMMDTVLNLGLNDAAVEGLAEQSGNARFAKDAYRRFIQMYGDVVMGVKHEHFEHALDAAKERKGVTEDTDLDADDLDGVIAAYQEIYAGHTGSPFPQAPLDQLWGAIDAVFGSWNSTRAIRYRQIEGIKGLLGTAVNVQSMVFGNFGDDSGTGVCFTRDPSTGENTFYGEYLINAQGEDVVAGIRTPLPLSQLRDTAPEMMTQLEGVRERLEKHYRDMQDMEFTIQQGRLFLLQTRNGKRTGPAAVKLAIDMVDEGLVSRQEAIGRVTADLLDQCLHPMIRAEARPSAKVLATGLNASPGAATGQVVFTAEDAEEWVAQGKRVLLVRRETSPEDIGGMHAAEGILTATGGMTSHAAVVARGMGTPCVAGCKEVMISGTTASIDGFPVEEGQWMTIDGGTGEVFDRELPLITPKVAGDLATFLEWTDEVRDGASREGLEGFGIRTNADLPRDAQVAREFGAEGIGLCRTEHMFFDEGKLEIFQEMIVAEDAATRKAALDRLLPLQREDFAGIFRAMDGFPVTVRLLDPPLHEFVPKTEADAAALAQASGVPLDRLQAKIEALHEMNPMLGHRGCRLGITYPEIYDMQVRAIMEAACAVAAGGAGVLPEIMIPLVGTVEELSRLRERAEKVAADVLANAGTRVDYQIGTMIEIPRAAVTADRVAEAADFFSFGTNDLTQMMFGYSRDDAGVFLPEYVEKGILEEDPFQVLDREGVGTVVEMGVQRGRATKPDLKVGICGEHGGDPSSIEFCYQAGMNYVSCSPYRVPIARLAAAHAVLGISP
ncbi:MAG: pyruvate, phosphate dikinase [Spirochaetaceae bacterium]|nr:pyruvate, phosphate dikinase [Spirochaetaceae bacterium]